MESLCPNNIRSRHTTAKQHSKKDKKSDCISGFKIFPGKRICKHRSYDHIGQCTYNRDHNRNQIGSANGLSFRPQILISGKAKLRGDKFIAFVDQGIFLRNRRTNHQQKRRQTKYRKQDHDHTANHLEPFFRIDMFHNYPPIRITSCPDRLSGQSGLRAAPVQSR